MVNRVFQRIVQGETLLIEARFVGEDIGGAVLRVEASGGLDEGGFVLSKPDSSTAEILNAATSAWAPGLYNLQLWFDWASGSLESEIALEISLSVEVAQ